MKKAGGGGGGSSAENVKVVVRCRPMNVTETADGNTRVVEVDVARGVVEVRSSKALATDPPKMFTFDAVYDWNSKQEELYDETFRPLIDSVLMGFNGTIFAYGQTGTGKTYTMEGITDIPEERGVIPNSFNHIFSHIARSSNQQFLIRASYLEIYQEEIRDLLVKEHKKKFLELKERPDTGVYVKDLQQFVCKSITEIQHVMQVGNQNRAVGATNMNQHSSRSHAIFIVTVESSELGSDGAQHIRAGKLNLVDLAGSERQAKTGSSNLWEEVDVSDQRTPSDFLLSHRREKNKSQCFEIPNVQPKASFNVQPKASFINVQPKASFINVQPKASSNVQPKASFNVQPKASFNVEPKASFVVQGERLKEATKINLSLSALGNVISALVDGKSSHIPYRDSKLTRLLQDSLGGNSKTIMVANIGPSSFNCDETLTTLRYASRAKNIHNKPKINQDPKDAILREYQDDIARLKNQLSHKLGKKRKKKKQPKAEAKEDQQAEASEEDEDADDLTLQKQQLEEERQHILNDKHLIEEEKQRLLLEVSGKEDELSQRVAEQQQLQAQVAILESRLLCGGKNIIDHTNEQQRELELQREQLAEQKRREREMLQRLEKEEESTGEIASTFSSLQHEVEAKTQKLKKMFTRLQSVKQEIVDLQEEFSNDRTDMQQTQEDLTKELKLKMLIIENFIPPEEKEKIINRAYFDEDEDCWKLRDLMHGGNGGPGSGVLKRPVSSSTRRPVSEYAKTQAALHHNPRFKGENIMVLDLDPPARTTRDWEGPEVAPQVAAALQAALTPIGDEEISIDASFSNLRSVKGARVAGARPKSSTHNVTDNSPSPYIQISESNSVLDVLSFFQKQKTPNLKQRPSAAPSSAGRPPLPQIPGPSPQVKNLTPFSSTSSSICDPKGFCSTPFSTTTSSISDPKANFCTPFLSSPSSSVTSVFSSSSEFRHLQRKLPSRPCSSRSLKVSSDLASSQSAKELEFQHRKSQRELHMPLTMKDQMLSDKSSHCSSSVQKDHEGNVSSRESRTIQASNTLSFTRDECQHKSCFQTDNYSDAIGHTDIRKRLVEHCVDNELCTCHPNDDLDLYSRTYDTPVTVTLKDVYNSSFSDYSPTCPTKCSETEMPLLSESHGKHLTFGNELTLSYVELDCPSNVSLISSSKREQILHSKLNENSEGLCHQPSLSIPGFSLKSSLCVCEIHESDLSEHDPQYERNGWKPCEEVSMFGRGTSTLPNSEQHSIKSESPTFEDTENFENQRLRTVLEHSTAVNACWQHLHSTSDEYSSPDTENGSSTAEESEDENNYLALLGLIDADDSDLLELAELYRHRLHRRASKCDCYRTSQAVLDELTEDRYSTTVDENSGRVTPLELNSSKNSYPFKDRVLWEGLRALSPLQESSMISTSSVQLTPAPVAASDEDEAKLLFVDSDSDSKHFSYFLPFVKAITPFINAVGCFSTQQSSKNGATPELAQRIPLFGSESSEIIPVGYSFRVEVSLRQPQLKRLQPRPRLSLTHKSFNVLVMNTFENCKPKKQAHDNGKNVSWGSKQDEFEHSLRLPSFFFRRYMASKLLNGRKMTNRQQVLSSGTQTESCCPKVKRRSLIRELFPVISDHSSPVVFPEFCADNCNNNHEARNDFLCMRKLHRRFMRLQRSHNWLLQLSSLTRMAVAETTASPVKELQESTAVATTDLAARIPPVEEQSSERKTSSESSKFSDDLSLSTMKCSSISSSSLHSSEFLFEFANSRAVARVLWRIPMRTRCRVLALLELYLYSLSGHSLHFSKIRSCLVNGQLTLVDSSSAPVKQEKQSPVSPLPPNEFPLLLFGSPIKAVRFHQDFSHPSASPAKHSPKLRKKIKPPLKSKPLIDLSYSFDNNFNVLLSSSSALHRSSISESYSSHFSSCGHRHGLSRSFSPPLTPVWMRTLPLSLSSCKTAHSLLYLRSQDSFGASEVHLSPAAAAFCTFCMWVFFLRLADGLISVLILFCALFC
ncbi:Kinesin motor domain [Trinorchestia longiramus]|nr:Kinesin motor domain [Trinorchestia longiramus]